MQFNQIFCITFSVNLKLIKYEKTLQKNLNPTNFISIIRNKRYSTMYCYNYTKPKRIIVWH